MAIGRIVSVAETSDVVGVFSVGSATPLTLELMVSYHDN
jgi:hypothetical protein